MRSVLRASKEDQQGSRQLYYWIGLEEEPIHYKLLRFSMRNHDRSHVIVETLIVVNTDRCDRRFYPDRVELEAVTVHDNKSATAARKNVARYSQQM